MHRRTSAVVVAGLLLGGCETMGSSPESALYWEAGKECEGRYRTIHLDRIDTEGNASAHADADSRIELPAFTQCYRDAIQKHAEELRKTGGSVPEGLSNGQSVDID